MKIRSDFVSNSSSSSFVFANHELFDYFKITKQDILNALIDLYGKENYEKEVERRKKQRVEHPDWFDKDELESKDIGPFWIYDLSIKEEREAAIRRWGNLLNGWDANNCGVITREGEDNGRVASGGENCTKYRTIIENIADFYGMSFWDMREHSVKPDKPLTRWVRTEKKDPETGCYGHHAPVEKEIVEFSDKLRRDMGIMSNLDVIKSQVARFFVHADDNEICGTKFSEDGVEDQHWDEEKEDWVQGSAKWESKSYTFDRLCEILIEYFEKTGKTFLNDPKFMDMMRIDDKWLSKYDKENGEFWDFINGKNFTWKDLKHIAMTWNMHEG
jgi:hypothetical protein